MLTTILLYTGAFIVFLIVLFIASCFYVLLRYSENEDDEYDDDTGWK